MKLVSKITIVALAAMLFSGAQTAEAFLTPSQIPFPKPIVIDITTHRGNIKDLDLRPQPCFKATLLMNESVRFDWPDKSKEKFIVKNAAGKIVFERSIDDNGNFEIVPASVGLKTGEEYSWSVDGGLNTYNFTILDEQTERELFDALAEIETDTNLSSDERIIKKAYYLQLLSDREAALDLYWLSVRWLNKISPENKQLADEKYDLLYRYTKHIHKRK